jgi:hypothetical protein
MQQPVTDRDVLVVIVICWIFVLYLIVMGIV